MRSTKATGMIAACLVVGYAGCAQHKEVVTPPETTGPGAKPSSGLPAPGAGPTSEPEPVIVTGSKIPTLSNALDRQTGGRIDIEKHGIRNPSNLVTPAILGYRFPWPPPRASAFDVIPSSLLVGDRAHSTLNDVADRLAVALYKNGYDEHGYYPIEDGFAIATHIEQMNENGTSKESGRWSVNPEIKIFSLRDYLQALFTAPHGHYRVIVFAVTTHPVRTSEEEVTRQQVTGWLSGGYRSLPNEIGRREFSVNYKCTALIYEFKGNGKQSAFVDPSELQGRTHLIKSGLLAALSTR